MKHLWFIRSGKWYLCKSAENLCWEFICNIDLTILCTVKRNSYFLLPAAVQFSSNDFQNFPMTIFHFPQLYDIISTGQTQSYSSPSDQIDGSVFGIPLSFNVCIYYSYRFFHESCQAVIQRAWARGGISSVILSIICVSKCTIQEQDFFTWKAMSELLNVHQVLSFSKEVSFIFFWKTIGLILLSFVWITLGLE